MKTIMMTTIFVLCITGLFAQGPLSNPNIITATVESVAFDGKSGTMLIDNTGEQGTFEVQHPNSTVSVGDKIGVPKAAPVGNRCVVEHWMVHGPWGSCPVQSSNCGLWGAKIVCSNDI